MNTQTNHERRRVVGASAAALLGSLTLSVFSQSPQQQEILKPYLEVKPYPGESKIIRVFFSPSCPFSRQYMAFFMNLAASLPASRSLVLTPLINHKDGITYALAFETVRLLWPKRLPEFVEASFKAVQDQGLDTSQWSGVSSLSKFSNFAGMLEEVKKHRQEVEVTCTSLIALQAHLRITNTPAVAVVGTYVATPEFTQGNPEMFSSLINAIISMSM